VPAAAFCEAAGVPFARAHDGTRLYYEVAGGGLQAPAVVLIMGLALRGEVWGETRDALASAGYRTVTFDNRGAGQSDSLRLRFTTSTMAQDAVAVMRAAFVDRAHVVGVSLGGMVAQELALQHPGRVRALVLQSTMAGWTRVDYLAPGLGVRTVSMARARLASPERRDRIALRVLTTRRYARDADLGAPRIRAMLDALADGVTFDGYLGQVSAGWSHHAWRRLRRIVAPTLIQHGTKDGLIRPAAARAMARRIAGAELELYPGAGHALALQCPDSLTSVLRFLQRHDA
jgi:pimeloyl-ACP methyl ester carboxylesterase